MARNDILQPAQLERLWRPSQNGENLRLYCAHPVPSPRQPHTPSQLMVITLTLARRFIDAYMHFLGSLLPDSAKKGKSTTQWLVLARKVYKENREVLDQYRKRHPQADADILDAIAALKVQRWIYLKDTRAYSVWMDETCEQAYGVLGLTQRIRDVAQGESGVVMTTGVMPLGGRWVTDGLAENLVWLGPNIRRDYAERYQHLRQTGRFSTGPT